MFFIRFSVSSQMLPRLGSSQFSFTLAGPESDPPRGSRKPELQHGWVRVSQARAKLDWQPLADANPIEEAGAGERMETEITPNNTANQPGRSQK